MTTMKDPYGNDYWGPRTVNPTLSDRMRGLLDTIASSETSQARPDGGYTQPYGTNTTFNINDPSTYDSSGPIMSGPNKGKTSTVKGRYQFRNLERGLYSPIDPTTNQASLQPMDQDAAGAKLATDVYGRVRPGRSLEDDLGDPSQHAAIGRALAGTWTSLPGGIETTSNDNRFGNTLADRTKNYTDRTTTTELDPVGLATNSMSADSIDRFKERQDLMSQNVFNTALNNPTPSITPQPSVLQKAATLLSSPFSAAAGGVANLGSVMFGNPSPNIPQPAPRPPDRYRQNDEIAGTRAVGAPISLGAPLSDVAPRPSVSAPSLPAAFNPEFRPTPQAPVAPSTQMAKTGNPLIDNNLSANEMAGFDSKFAAAHANPGVNNNVSPNSGQIIGPGDTREYPTSPLQPTPQAPQAPQAPFSQPAHPFTRTPGIAPNDPAGVYANNAGLPGFAASLNNDMAPASPALRAAAVGPYLSQRAPQAVAQPQRPFTPTPAPPLASQLGLPAAPFSQPQRPISTPATTPSLPVAASPVPGANPTGVPSFTRSPLSVAPETPQAPAPVSQPARPFSQTPMQAYPKTQDVQPTPDLHPYPSAVAPQPPAAPSLPAMNTPARDPNALRSVPASETAAMQQRVFGDNPQSTPQFRQSLGLPAVPGVPNAVAPSAPVAPFSMPSVALSMPQGLIGVPTMSPGITAATVNQPTAPSLPGPAVTAAQEAPSMPGTYDTSHQPGTLSKVGSAVKGVGRVAGQMVRGASVGNMIAGPGGALVGLGVPLANGLMDATGTNMNSLFGGPVAHPGSSPATSRDVVANAAPSVLAQANRLDLGPAPAGYHYGYSPFGQNIAAVSNSAPENSQIAGTGPGILGEFGFGTSKDGYNNGPNVAAANAAAAASAANTGNGKDGKNGSKSGTNGKTDKTKQDNN